MSGLVLLIIGLVCLALILAMVALVGRKAWRVFKRVRAVSHGSARLAAELAGRAQGMQLNVSGLQANAAQLQENLQRLQATADRLRVLSDAWRQAMVPYHGVRDFFGK